MHSHWKEADYIQHPARIRSCSDPEVCNQSGATTCPHMQCHSRHRVRDCRCRHSMPSMPSRHSKLSACTPAPSSPQADAQAAGAVARHKAAPQVKLLGILGTKSQQVAIQLGAPACRKSAANMRCQY